MIEYIIISLLLLIGLSGIRIVNQTERAAVETLGKYTSYRGPGFSWIIPIFQHMRKVNVTEQMANVEPQDIITSDNLNARTDLVIFYKVRSDEDSFQKALYNVNNYESQIITLAQTTARNVIGDMVFKDVNSKRNDLNTKLAKVMAEQTKTWGVDIVRVELKEITPPSDVQETMNRVIKAENEKTAAVDFATAFETEADGKKRAAIKEAEGIAQGRIIVADATAKQIKIVNEAADKYFKGNAQKLKQFEIAGEALKNNSKVILGDNANGILKLFDLNK